ncbi:MAG TPA: hypothetical protein VFV32_09750 [Acidimicrobiales bacterium]|nr:hypothetical protein [Acidimicrobiales bacterium]
MPPSRLARSGLPLLFCIIALAGACGADDADDGGGATDPSAAASHDGAAPLVDPLANGPMEPGRYRLTVIPECPADLLDCPDTASSARPINVDVTVPAGWDGNLEFQLLHPSIPAGAEISTATGAPDGAALVMGWTTAWVGLHSDPCTPVGLPGGHQVPDTPVGPTVADFVDAVQAHPGLQVTEPTDVHLGDHDGQFFGLTAPSDLSSCDNWRPWDPGIYAQGPKNLWDVWVMDVDGDRALIVANYFPDTPAEIKTQLRQMAESIRLSLGPGRS